MKRLPLLFTAFGLGRALAAAENPASVAALFVTPDNLQVVREADKVDVCILRHINAVTLPDGRIDWKTEHYEETAFTPVMDVTATALRDLVLSERTYDWKATGGRRPQFYLRLRFHRAATVVTVDFCFLCHALSVTRDGQELGHASFGRNGDLFLMPFLKLFPHDEPLQRAAREAGLPQENHE